MTQLLAAKDDSKIAPWTVTWPSGTKQSYLDLLLSVAFGDPKKDEDLSKHAAVVVGRRQDNTYECIWEYLGKTTGDNVDLGKALIEAKDNLVLDEMLLPGEAEEHQLYLNALDGLTRYKAIGIIEDEQPWKTKWEHKDDYWPSFKSRNIMVHVISAPLTLDLEYPSWVSRLQELLAQQRLAIETRRCPSTVVALQSGFTDLLAHPLIRALIQSIWLLDLRRAYEQAPEEEPEPEGWYGNRT